MVNNGPRWKLLLLAAIAASLSAVPARADLPRFKKWDELIPLASANEAEVGAQLAYAAFLATEPADFEAAEAVLLSGARWAPREPAFVQGLFVLWRQQGHIDEQLTEAVLEKLIPLAEANPGAPYLQVVIARAERYTGDLRKARRRLEKCLKRNRWREPEVLREWLLCLDPKKDAEMGAKRIADLETEPGLYGNWVFERAAADFLHKVAMNDDNWRRRKLQLRAWHHRLRAAEDREKQASAETAVPLTKLLLRMGLNEQALALVEGLAETQRQSPQTEIARAHLYESYNRWQDAFTVWQRLLKDRDTIGAYHLGAARCLDALGRPREATDAIAKASRLAIDPQKAIPLGLTAANRYLRQQEPDKALSVLAGLPPHHLVYLARARAHRDQNQLQNALEALHKARESHPNHPLILELTGQTLYDLHKFLGAKKALEAALKYAPKSAHPRLKALLRQVEQALVENGKENTFLRKSVRDHLVAMQFSRNNPADFSSKSRKAKRTSP
jgi:tetratricopeptide (TPR) repeat protein